MFKLLDGRKSFYQWDINRKIVVSDETIKEVHFCNRQSECSLVCDVYTDANDLRVADVPNIILQKNHCINVYAYDGEATRHQKTFLVKARSKPEDYVYTETEIKTWEELEEKVNSVTTSTDQTIRNVIYSTTQDTIATDDTNPIKTKSPVSSIAVAKYVEDMLQAFANERIVALENAIKDLK
jgi:hypothetical protein